MKRKIKATLIIYAIFLNMLLSLPMNYINNDKGKTVENPFDILEDNDIPEQVRPAIENIFTNETVTYPSNYDIGKVLGDRDNKYTEIFEPWKSKAAIHSVAYHEDTGFLALGGGYLYDNEIHIYRLNTETGDFDKVWVAGDGIIQSDVLCLDFGDTDLNNFLEIVAGSSDGHVYVFEQRHIYDPITNTENMFDHVWTSPSMFRVFDVKVEDTDRDYRPDIIVGSWDGIFFYEYDDHSGYPFNEEHWITYEQVYSNDVEGEKIYSIEAGDTNVNGLPDIVCGTREGTIFIFENDGISMEINGDYFPLVQDNAYKLDWTSENYTWTPIRSMDIGELDGTVGDEIAIIAQGQGLFTLDWDEASQTYSYEKVVRDYEEWETFGYWGLDSWVDRVISANNVTYFDPINDSIIVPEPINYVWNDILEEFVPDADCYPYNTGMAMETDGNYTTFNASVVGVDNATAIVDFGLDEEGTGSANSNPDLIVTFKNNLNNTIYEKFNFSISQNGADFEQISSEFFNYDGSNPKELKIDVDDVLISRNWDWFRYAKISVFNATCYEINSIELLQVYNLLTDGLTVEIGPLNLNGYNFIHGISELDKIIVGTVTGKYIGVGWIDDESCYEILYDSGNDDFYTAEAGIWDMVHISTAGSASDVPIWLPISRPSFDHEQLLSPPTDYSSWSYGKINPYGTANYFVGTNLKEIFAYSMAEGEIDTTVNIYLGPINTYLASKDKTDVSVEVSSITEISSNPFIAVASFDPNKKPIGNQNDGETAEINFFLRDNLATSFSIRHNMEYYDLTGEITSLIAMSKTLPKMDFVDFDDDGDKDMIFSNGNLYFAKNLYEETGVMNFTLINGYFYDVNTELKSKGWGQPEIFDLNDDGKLDIILSYDDKCGATAFLNDGTVSDPVWIQNKHIFSNTRPETNMKYMKLTDLRIIPSGTGSTLDIAAEIYNFDVPEFSLVAYNNNTHHTSWMEPIFNAVNSYVVATYPKVMTTDFCVLDTGETEFLNYGFHIHEGWNNEDDLKSWTLSIASGDLDGDGNGEIIIGDYDNNIYTFEHMVGNTYKRMDRTFDLNHTEVSDESPYLYEELEGISGDFTRKIWDHAKHLLTDVDLDKDGLKELIVASNLQIYIFEDRGLTGGDDLAFVYSIDLRDLGFTDEVS